jgi:hypothetical protein
VAHSLDANINSDYSHFGSSNVFLLKMYAASRSCRHENPRAREVTTALITLRSFMRDRLHRARTGELRVPQAVAQLTAGYRHLFPVRDDAVLHHVDELYDHAYAIGGSAEDGLRRNRAFLGLIEEDVLPAITDAIEHLRELHREPYRSFILDLAHQGTSSRTKG